MRDLSPLFACFVPVLRQPGTPLVPAALLSVLAVGTVALERSEGQSGVRLGACRLPRCDPAPRPGTAGGAPLGQAKCTDPPENLAHIASGDYGINKRTGGGVMRHV